MNPIFIYENVNNATLTASAGSATNYPLTNLQDDRYATQWKSGAKTQNQTLTAQFSSAINMDCVLICNHNFASLGITLLRIEYSNYGDDWFEVAIVASYTDPLFVSFTSASKAYIRLTFYKSGQLNVEPQIGMLYIGKAIEMPLYANNPERGVSSDAVVAESLSGLKYSSSLHGVREQWKLDFAKCPTSSLYSFMKLIVGVNGMQYPFWFRDMDGNWHFVRFKKNYLPFVGVGNVNFPFKGIELEEERVGNTINLPGNYSI